MGQHWYCGETGEPKYTVKAKNGNDRDTTLADARKLNYWPSVTTIIQNKAEGYHLKEYKQNQLLNAAWQQLFIENEVFEDFDKFKSAIVLQSKKHAKDAADRGTQIHDALENWYLNREDRISLEDVPFISAVVDFLDKEFPGVAWQPEHSFCNSDLGFGGKVDVSSTCERGIILDFKTKDNEKKFKSYDEYKMQTAAYAVGLNMANADRYCLFIHSREPGVMKLEKHEDFDRDWRMFRSLLTYWQLDTGHMPESKLGGIKHG